MENLIVRWAHIRPEKQMQVTKLNRAKDRKLAQKHKNATICKIIHKDTREVISEAKVECSIQDVFVKKIGRKLSFTKAINQITDKTVRKQLWEKHLPSIIG